MRFIGDIHGNIHKYESIINGSTNSVQVGDFGIGFLTLYEEAHVDSMHVDGRHKFIRGNHDDPGRCKSRPGYIEDGTFDAERSILYIGGAWSIDWMYRTPGYSWWADEELSVPELSRMHELMEYHKPKIMVTHDCPSSVAYDMFLKYPPRTLHQTRTGEAFEGMFRRYQPDIWIFGHWHHDRDQVINGTRFVALGIDSYMDIPV